MKFVVWLCVLNIALVLPVAQADILSEICYIRFGVPLRNVNRLAFRSELVLFHKHQTQFGRETLSEQAIRAWLPEAGVVRGPKRSAAMRFLSGYLGWIDGKGLVPDEERRKRSRALDLSLRLHNPPAGKPDFESLSGDSKNKLASLRLGAPEPYLLLTLQVINALSAKNRNSESDDFFRGGDPDAVNDRSYFIVYRFSTVNGNVLKSLLVIKKPDQTTGNTFTFNHFVWPMMGNPVTSKNQAYQESEGIILKFDKAYYFIGYNYEVKENKRLYQAEYQRKRLNAKLNPNGFSMLAVEYESIGHDFGLLDGIAMTMAASSQPVVGRLALLHLGTKSALGVNLNDLIVQPAELEMHEGVQVGEMVASDLKETVARINSLGAKRYSEKLHRFFKEDTFKDDWASVVSTEIILHIDNMPAYETKRSEKKRRSQKQSSHLARGAIEIFGKHRP